MLQSMNTQNQIKRTLSTSTSIEYIKQLLRGNKVAHRSDLAKQVCINFEFHDARGEMQTSGCLKALRELESSGHFDLPKAQHKTGTKSPRRLTTPVPLAVDVPDEVNSIKTLELVHVQEVEEMRIWNELMLTEHYLEAATLVGRQMRYLIRSEHGWLGGIGFAAPALQLSARDQWIGWNKEERQAQLHTIVGMSRFLIRPSVNCKNLASKVLGMSMATIATDFDQQYGYRPLLIESFVDTEHYSGTCYQAANWIAIGKTKGRGRQDRYSKSTLSQKMIVMYEITAMSVDINFCKKFLKEHLKVITQQNLSPEKLILAVANFSNLSISELKSARRSKQIAYYRQISMYLLKKYSHLSFSEIGGYLGGKTQAAVHFGYHRIENTLKEDKMLNQVVTKVLQNC